MVTHPLYPLGTPDTTGTVNGRSALADLERAVNDYLLLDDPDALVVILGVVAAQKLSGDTPWLMIIGPSSGAKTELLSLLREVPGIFELSDLTDKTLAAHPIRPARRLHAHPSTEPPHDLGPPFSRVCHTGNETP